MYGGPIGGPHGPGFGGPHHGPHHGGYHGPHYGPFYGPFRGPHYGYYHHLRPYYFGASRVGNNLDYMKIIESNEEGKKYYNFCSCEKCSESFGLDYRVAKDVTFISLNDVTFANGNYEYKNKVDGLFKFNVICPECKQETAFFVNIRTMPQFVIEGYLKETKKIEYFVNYEFKENKKSLSFNFNVCKNVENPTIKKINDIVSNFDFDYLIRKNGNKVLNREQLTMIALKGYEKLNGLEPRVTNDFKVKIKDLKVNNNIFSKFRRARYLFKTNGIKGLVKAVQMNDDDKKNIALLIKK